MINNVTLVGRLTKDVDLRYTPSGVPTARFTLAVNRQFKQDGGPEADFVSCVTWRKTAENLANFMKKGNLIGLTGRIQTGSYEGQDGKRVYTTDVVADNIQFLEPRNNTESNTQANNNHSYYNPNQTNLNQNLQNNNQQHQNPQNNGAQQQYEAPPQNNYTRVDEDPFANGKGGPVEINEDDLPF